MSSFSTNEWKATKYLRFLVFFCALALFSLVLFSSLKPTTASLDQISGLKMAPPNPDFVAFLQAMEERRPRQTLTPEGFGLGEVPPPLNLDHNQGITVFPPRETYPSAYDLRLLAKLTPIKNQGSCGSCWAFATYGSLESFLLLSEYWDFSEQHLIDNHGFDYGPCAGGNHWMSSAYLGRWSGPVLEQDDPYIYSSTLDQNGVAVRKHVQEVIFLPSRSNYLDNDNIKAAVTTYGAVYASMYWSASYYNSAYFAYYCNLSGSGTNHAVAIVGWDDNFDRNKFNPVPPGNGAFIMRNSWGSSWGEGGYFYLSYYDTRFQPGACFTAEATSNYSGIYNYDYLGWVTSFGYGSNTAWGANIFAANSSDPITAIGLYTASVNSSYELYIYTGVNTGNPRSGTMVFSQSGTIASPGYHTIALSSPVALSPGTLFSVVLKLTTPGYNYPIPAEKPYAGYSSGATANPNESFISSDGTSWSDLGASSHKANICLKAFTRIASQGYPISGYVRDALGNGVTLVTLNGLPSSPQTDSNGYYLDQVPLGWSGTATPLNPGYTFTPSSRTYASVNHSYNNQNYLAVSGSCSYSISPLSANYPSVGGLGNISVTAGSGCSWTAISQASWIIITSGSSGTGSGTVSYQVATNFSPGLRQGQIIVAGQAFLISQEGSGAAFTPNNFQIIPEVIWAAATGGGTWVTEIQVIDLTGGSQVRASFYCGGGLSRGPFLVWTNSGQAGRTIRFSNFLSQLQTGDSGFNYYGRVGAVTFFTQDTGHRILVTARTVNGNFGKTFPGINPVSSELAYVGHEMILTNLASTGTYRSFAGFFNPSAFPVTVSFTLHDSLGNIIGSPFTETFTGNDFKSFNIFVKAGITSSGYSNCWFKIQPTSGSGQLICFGSSANNYSNDTAAHFAFSAGPGYINSPSNNQVIPEVIWASATGGGTWTTEVQVLDQSGGSQVQVFFRYGGGASRGPFLLWTNSGGAGRAARFTNLLASLDGMDPDPTFSYFGRVGAVEFITQDNDHRIVVTARTVNGNYGKTFPGLNKITSHLAQVGSDMILTNLDKNLSYRSFAGGYNPTSSSLTVEFYLFDDNGNQLGNSFIENFAGYDFKSFNVFQKAGLTEDYSNCFLKIHPLFGSGQLLCYASSANNASNDTAAHISILR